MEQKLVLTLVRWPWPSTKHKWYWMHMENRTSKKHLGSHLKQHNVHGHGLFMPIKQSSFAYCFWDLLSFTTSQINGEDNHWFAFFAFERIYPMLWNFGFILIANLCSRNTSLCSMQNFFSLVILRLLTTSLFRHKHL